MTRARDIRKVRGRGLAALAAAVLLAACALPGAALAVGEQGASDDAITSSDAATNGDAALGVLSSRYEELEALDSSTDVSEQVVVDTHIGVLTAVNRALDGATVSFSGEAIGDIINADADHKWVNLLASDGGSIGVYMTTEQAAQIVHLGDYYNVGTTLQIKGVYHTSCGDHQGELDVHATEITVTDLGSDVTHTIDARDVMQGLALCGVALVLLIAFFVARRVIDVRDADRQAEEEVTWEGRSKMRKRSEARKKRRQKKRRERRFWPRRKGDK